MNVIVLGSCGMLGRAWRQLLQRKAIAHTHHTGESLDVRDTQSLARALESPADVIINCAAYTDVDGAEEHEALAHAINAHAVEHLAEHCRAEGRLLVHYSTDYVFDGTAKRPYPCSATPSPINAYGRSKLAGERALRRAAPEHLLVRTSWLQAPWGHNFIATMQRLMQERDALDVVTDQIGRPTDARWLAHATLELITQKARGTYHLANEGTCSWYDLALAVRAGLGPNATNTTIRPVTTDAFPRPAKRPHYSVLDLDQTRPLLSAPIPPWQQALHDILQQPRS